MRSKSKLSLTATEEQWLYDHDYAIRWQWMSPYEGYEFRLYHMGGEKVLAFRKSERACYNAARRLEKSAPPPPTE